MLVVGIKLVEGDYQRVLSALDRVERAAATRMKDMPRQGATGYCNLLYRNIANAQTANFQYIADPTSRYGIWKRKYGRMGFPAPWKLFGDLLAAIQPFKVTDGWMGGIPADAFAGGKSWFGKGDQGDSKPIAMYAWENEKRSRIFYPTMTEYEPEWIELGGKALQDVAMNWR